MNELVWVANVYSGELKYGKRVTNGVEGAPRPTDVFTTDQLEARGFVGIYKREGDASFEIRTVAMPVFCSLGDRTKIEARMGWKPPPVPKPLTPLPNPNKP